MAEFTFGPYGEEEDDEQSSNRPPGRDEMNLAEFPLAALGRPRDGDNSFSYEGYITDVDGLRHLQRWTVHGAGGIGLPTEFDERVLVALMAISGHQGFKKRKVSFSIYRILQIMGIDRSAKAYESIERSLKRLFGVTIFAEGSFWDNSEKVWVKFKSGFRILDKFWLASREPDVAVRTAEGVQGYFVWSEDIWRSFQAGYLKSLDLDVYYGLNLPLARRLYRFLDKRMAYQDRYQIDVFDLAGRLGMAQYPYPSNVIRKLQPSIDELIAHGFLLRSEVVKVRGYTRLAFWRQATGTRLLESLPLTTGGEGEQAAQPDEKSDLLAALTKVGLSERVASELVGRFERQRIQEKLDYLLWSQESLPKSIRSPSGWLRRAIEDDWQAPEGYHDLTQRPDSQAQQTTLQTLFDEGNDVAEEEYLEDPLQALWEAIQRDLALQLTRTTYDSILSSSRLVAFDGEEAVIEVASHYALETLTNRLARQVGAAFAKQGHEGVKFRVRGATTGG